MKTEKVIFKNRLFYLLLIFYLIILIGWNVYALITGNIKAIFQIIIEGVVLFLILSEIKHAKIGIKIWAIILILSNGTSLFAKLIKISFGDENVFFDLLNKVIFLVIGILIYFFNEKHTKIKTTSI